MAGQLRNSAEGMNGTAEAAPETPQVSTSAERVGHTLSEITKTVAGLIAGVEQTAGKIDASDGGYGQTENRSATDIRRSGSGLSSGTGQ